MITRREFILVSAAAVAVPVSADAEQRQAPTETADYKPGKPFGLRGRLIYKEWAGAEETTARYSQWRQKLQ